MIFYSVPPLQPDAAVAEARDHHRVLDRNGALVIIAVQRPGLHLSLVELAAMQQTVKRMQVMVTRGADPAQRRFQLFGAPERRIAAEREDCHPVQGHRVQSVISVPSAGICQPARSAMLRSGEAGSS